MHWLVNTAKIGILHSRVICKFVKSKANEFLDLNNGFYYLYEAISIQLLVFINLCYMEDVIR